MPKLRKSRVSGGAGGTADDIVRRLRESSTQARAIDRSELLNEAAGVIERLRESIRRLAEQDATLSAVGGNVIVEMDATLTDAEREAVERAASFADDAAGYCKNPANADAARKQAATLRGLLERLK